VPLLRRYGWLLALAVIAVVVFVVRVDYMMVDFAVFQRAGVRVLDATPLYQEGDGHYQFKYFPAFALAMIPFAAFSPETGEAIWFVLSIVLVVVFVRACVRALPSPRLSRTQLTWLAVLLVGRFYVREVALGQTNALLGVLLIYALLAAQQQRDTAAGALVGAAVFVKPYAVIFIPWLLVTHGWRAMASCFVVLLAGLVAPAAVYGWQGNLDLLAGWWRTVTETTAPNLLIPENVSIATMWVKWIGPGMTATVLAGATLVAVAGLVIFVLARRRGVREPDYLEFGLLMLLIPLASPQGWDYVLMLATPVVLCLVDRMHAMPGAWRAIGWAAIVVMSFTIFDLVGRAIYTTFMALSMVTVAALVQAGVLARLRWQRIS
jgi:hypothetical protein